MLTGIVDLGSNTIRLSIYHYDTEQSFKSLLNKKKMIGLAGYVNDGMLTEEGIQIASSTIKSYRNLLRNFNIHDIHIFATASIRNVKNAAIATEEIQQRTGTTIDLLSGEEEASYSFLGATHGRELSNGILADIGGGSIELVSYEDKKITAECSLTMGSLSLFRNNVNGLFPNKKEQKVIRGQVYTALEKDAPNDIQVEALCGVGGSIRGVSKLITAMNHNDKNMKEFSAVDLERLYDLLKQGSLETQRLILKVVPDRIHTIIPGALALREIVNYYGIQTIYPSTMGVREGYLIERVIKQHVGAEDADNPKQT